MFPNVWIETSQVENFQKIFKDLFEEVEVKYLEGSLYNPSNIPNPSSAVYFWKLYWNKNLVKFLFSHFFVVRQKVLWRPFRHYKEVWK